VSRGLQPAQPIVSLGVRSFMGPGDVEARDHGTAFASPRRFRPRDVRVLAPIRPCRWRRTREQLSAATSGSRLPDGRTDASDWKAKASDSKAKASDWKAKASDWKAKASDSKAKASDWKAKASDSKAKAFDSKANA